MCWISPIPGVDGPKSAQTVGWQSGAGPDPQSRRYRAGFPAVLDGDSGVVSGLDLPGINPCPQRLKIWGRPAGAAALHPIVYQKDVHNIFDTKQKFFWHTWLESES